MVWVMPRENKGKIISNDLPSIINDNFNRITGNQDFEQGSLDFYLFPPEEEASGNTFLPKRKALVRQ